MTRRQFVRAGKRLRGQIQAVALMVAIIALTQGAGVRSVEAGVFEGAFWVCGRHHCRLEPGSQYHFKRLFAEAGALTRSGARGVWQPVRRSSRHRHWR